MKKLHQETTHSLSLVRVFLFSLVAFLSIFEPAFSVSASTIRIGEIDPLTGKLAKHGLEIHEGIRYAIDEVNSRGGIGGRQVELFSRDDQSEPEVAINQAEELLCQAKVIGLVGGYVDSLVGPISEIAGRNRTPYVASASLQRSLTVDRDNPYFFRVSHLDGIVQPLCRFISDILHPERAAILFSATPGSTELAEEVRTCLGESGISVSLFEKFRPGYPDFSSFLLKARQAKVDVLISGGFFPDHLILVRQLRELQIPLKAYIGPWGIAYNSFIEEMGEAGKHLFGMCAWNPGIAFPGAEEQSREFERRFHELYGKEPSTTTMHGYASARALLSAMENTIKNGRELTGEAISQELRALDLLLPMERLAFDKHGDPKDYQQLVVQIQKGKLIPVYPPNRAAGKPIYPMSSQGKGSSEP